MPFFQDLKDQFVKKDKSYYENQLYPFQDEILSEVFSGQTQFYLSGGTALNRFILENNRYSDDLDFFMNLSTSKEDLNYFHASKDALLKKISQNYSIEPEKNISLFSDYDFLSDSNYVYYAYSEETRLKIQFVLDYRKRLNLQYLNHPKYKIDNASNILTNKIAAIMNRKSFKDIVDKYITPAQQVIDGVGIEPDLKLPQSTGAWGELDETLQAAIGVMEGEGVALSPE